MKKDYCVNKKIGRKQFSLERKREAIEAQIAVIRAEFEAEKSESLAGIGIDKERNERYVCMLPSRLPKPSPL